MNAMHLATRSAVLLALMFCSLPAASQSLPDWAQPSMQPAQGTSTLQNHGGGGDPPDPPPDPVPLDGGLGLLALAGGAYALRELKRQRVSL